MSHNQSVSASLPKEVMLDLWSSSTNITVHIPVRVLNYMDPGGHMTIEAADPESSETLAAVLKDSDRLLNPFTGSPKYSKIRSVLGLQSTTGRFTVDLDY